MELSLDLVKEMLHTKSESVTTFQNVYSSYFTKYPKFMDMLLTEHTVDLNMISYLLNIREQCVNGSLTSFDSDVLVGERLAEKYIYNASLKKPSTTQRCRLLETLKNL
jgi:hypothetical protein